METRKTTITLPVDLWESLRVRAAREHTTMSELVRLALEAYDPEALRRPERRQLAGFLHASESEARSWVVGEGTEPEDFDDADTD